MEMNIAYQELTTNTHHDYLPSESTKSGTSQERKTLAINNCN